MIRTVFRPAALAAALCIGAASARAQAPTGDDELLGYASMWLHGVGSIPDSIRTRVATNPRALQLYADVLEGRRAQPREWSVGTALWWLAEGGDARYLPLFLRYTAQPTAAWDPGLQESIYGLARHAASPAAAARLRELGRRGRERWLRVSVAGPLILINEEPTRALLREILGDDLPATQRQAAQKALAGPAARPGSGRVPCAPSQKFGPDSTGAYRCISDSARASS
jgi:hypothetical protein